MLQWERRHPWRRLTTSHSKKNRAAASSLPPSARPPRTARKRANGPTFPPKQKARTSSRRASSTPNARKRAPRMTPLQTSSDPEVADWEKPLGAACFTRRLGTAWSGVVLGADWEWRPSGRLPAGDRDVAPPGDWKVAPPSGRQECRPSRATGKSPLLNDVASPRCLNRPLLAKMARSCRQQSLRHPTGDGRGGSCQNFGPGSVSWLGVWQLPSRRWRPERPPPPASTSTATSGPFSRRSASPATVPTRASARPLCAWTPPPASSPSGTARDRR